MLKRFWNWIRSWFIAEEVKPISPSVYDFPASPVYLEPDRIKPTKAYADQRQKMPHNRKRKPSKAMRNLYQLN